MPTDEERAATILEAVEAESLDRLEPLASVEQSRDDWPRWRAFDIASIVEGCFHEQVDPVTLDHAQEQRWQERLEGCFAFPPRDGPASTPIEQTRRYWLLADEERAGTIALATSAARGPWLIVRSLYVDPPHRRRGLAGELLDRLADAAHRHGLAGLRLGTCWTWQKALRFYLARGFWVTSWKHDIQLALEPRLPERRFTVEGDQAALDIVQQGRLHRLFVARKSGHLLELEELPARDEIHRRVGHLAIATFAVHLALGGWPLVRSEEQWSQRFRWADAGQPEGLAYKIAVFEDIATEAGWVVDTTPIPDMVRWRAWGRGEEHGRTQQRLRDLEVVLSARGFRLDPARRDSLRELDPYVALEQLLRHAVTAPSEDAWWTAADQLLEQRRRRRG